MKKASSRKYAATQIKFLNKLTAKKGADIDFSDIPEEGDWTGAKRGIFYRPVKQQLTLRLKTDVADWFNRQGEDC